MESVERRKVGLILRMDLWRRVKTKAAELGITMQEFVESALVEKVKEKKKCN